MELAYYNTLVWASQILALWMPVALGGCRQEFQALGFEGRQKIIPFNNGMRTDCQTLLNRETEECSPDCDEWVRKLLDLYDGRPIFFTCDCSDSPGIYPEDQCLNVQERLVVCPTLRDALTGATHLPSTTPTILVDGRIPCDTARQRCEGDANCKSQFDATIAACDGPGCSKECQHSLDTLLARRQAQGLWNCSGCSEGTGTGNWCSLSKRCTDAQQGTVLPYKPGGTAKTTDNDSQGGSARKSVKPSPRDNGAVPSCSPCILWVGLLIASVSLSIAYV